MKSLSCPLQTRRLVHKNTNLCLQAVPVSGQVLLKECSSSPEQRWNISTRKELQAMYRSKGVPIDWSVWEWDWFSITIYYYLWEAEMRTNMAVFNSHVSKNFNVIKKKFVLSKELKKNTSHMSNRHETQSARVSKCRPRGGMRLMGTELCGCRDYYDNIIHFIKVHVLSQEIIRCSFMMLK